MASRPLPPGRRGRGARATPTLHLPDVKILSDAPTAPPTSSYAEQLRAQPQPAPPAVIEPEHESTTKETEYEPAPVRSVKAFVSSLEKAQDPAAPVYVAPAAAAGEDAWPRIAQEAVADKVYDAPAAPPRVAIEKPASPVAAAPVATTPKKPGVQPPVQQVHIPTPPVQVVVAAPSVATHPAPVTVGPAVPTADASAFEGIHPFKALLPIYAVPDIPETVDCVFDDEALEMQKNIMKVVKKVFGKDRSKLEDFKINSRLFGNNFMDPLEYVESLVKDLGGNRALLLVPCLVSIQPDFMKRSSMLVAARNYRLRSLSKLEAALDKVEVDAPASVSAPVEQVLLKTEEVPVVSGAVAAAAVATTAISTHEVVYDAACVSPAADLLVEETSSLMEVMQEQAPEMDVTVEHCFAEEPADACAPPAEEGAPEAAIEAVSQPNLALSEPIAYAVSEPVAYTVTEPVMYAAPEPQAVEAVLAEPTATKEEPLAFSPAPLEAPAAEPVVIEQAHNAPVFSASSALVDAVATESAWASQTEPITPVADVEAPHTTTATTTMPLATRKLESTASFITVDTTVSSERPSASSAPVTPSAASSVHHQPVRRKSTISLFGEEIADDDDEDDEDEDEVEEDVKTIVTTTSAVAPATATARVASPKLSSTSSFYDAESLFGEVIPVVVKPVTESPAPITSVLKPPPARMLFGFASAGADSDSDSDSEFSD